MTMFRLLLAAVLLMLGPSIVSAEAVPSVSGTVQQYLLSPHGEVDGLLLTDGTVVKFPPHLGIALASSVKPSDPVAVTGFLGTKTAEGRAIKALTITNTKTGQALLDQPLSNFRTRLDHQTVPGPLSATGSFARFLVNTHGDVDALILSGGEQVKFGPKHGEQVKRAVEGAQGTITANGHGVRNAFGTVLKVESLTVNGKTVVLAEKKHGKKKKHGKDHDKE